MRQRNPDDRPELPPAPNLHPMPEPGTYDQAALVVCAEHPDELRVTGVPVRCPACDARRDWLLVHHRGHTFIRCRCAHQRHEPDLGTDDFDNLTAGPPDRYWATYSEALVSLGFDGTFAGVYL
ncbi:hypothetical protein [Embleya sp. NPDC059237]|uniref:hypothetical protein n=1 Tax=Embleya sp. NPDC059237 TaxID=3346784 RepID=UPI00367F0022